jgi:hypothetical protein
VRCGKALYQYHHFDPPFEDATEHNPKGITLLCGGCHDEATRGRLSPESIRAANEDPVARRQGWSWDSIDFNTRKPKVRVGPITFENCCGDLVAMYGNSLLKVEEPEEPGGPFQLSARLGSFFHPGVVIERNELVNRNLGWDVVTEGPTTEIKHGPGHIVFRMITNPRDEISFEVCEFEGHLYRLKCRKDVAELENLMGRRIWASGETRVTHSVGIVIDDQGIRYC